MAKPRIFISSTYYDLKQTREDVANFLTSLGYEPIRNENGNIPYGPNDKLEDYCYKEIHNVDILVSIIGGRYGSEAQSSQWSISNQELLTALRDNKQVYIFIDKNVDSEYMTYLKNKDNTDIKYCFVDNIQIYKFIEQVRGVDCAGVIGSLTTKDLIEEKGRLELPGRPLLNGTTEKHHLC